MNEAGKVTELLAGVNIGDKTAMDELIPLVEKELRRLAHQFMRRENGHHTLQTTALVNEAYIKLTGQRQNNWQNRNHFFAIAAQIMRRILISHARQKKTAKREHECKLGSDYEPMVLSLRKKSSN